MLKRILMSLACSAASGRCRTADQDGNMQKEQAIKAGRRARKIQSDACRSKTTQQQKMTCNRAGKKLATAQEVHVRLLSADKRRSKRR